MGDNWRFFELVVHSDSRGCLVALEENDTIPFEIKRIFYIYGADGCKRGCHAHMNAEEFVVCVKGSCTFVLDDGKSREKILLSQPAHGLMIQKMVWIEMEDFTADCVLLVLCNKRYQETHSLNTYDSFLQTIKELERGKYDCIL